MRRIALNSALALVAVTTASGFISAQTAAPKQATSTSAAHHTTATATTAMKLPPGIPPVKGVLKTAFSLKYQDVKIGTGAVAEPNKLYKVNYTGWLASDGKKFDSSFDHTQPIVDKDGKPEKDADGKPKMTEAQPIQFPQGRGRVIPGWDQGFEGMKIGGKRRLFIPYQLAYGATGRPPVIPAKADLIFDIELVDVSDMPAPGTMGMPPGHPPIKVNPGAPGSAGAPGQKPAAPGSQPSGQPSGQPATPGAPSSPATPPAPAAPAKPTDPTVPTTAPNSAAPKSAPAPSSPSAPATPPAKPANPAQPNGTN